MKKKTRILVAPMDWGLGHATRCVPLIKELQNQGVEVVLGTSGAAGILLQREFPKLENFELPGYEVSYPKNGNMLPHLLKQTPRLLRVILEEQQLLKRAIPKMGLDGVISDNRFGLYSESIPVVFMTHQLWIKAPAFASVVRAFNHRYINRFDECWIPDVDSEYSLSGELGHPVLPKLPCRYIGPLSRFQPGSVKKAEYDLVAVVSGPEPQRGLFQEILEGALANNKAKSLLICGVPGAPFQKKINNMEVVSHLDSKAMQRAIEKAEMVICRSGYSSMMDLFVLGKPAILVPTPGQTEQEYLAQYHANSGQYVKSDQKDFNLEELLLKAKGLNGEPMREQKEVLGRVVRTWLGRFS